MGKMGNGYGSECHLLRWMGRHRKKFDEEVLSAIGCPYSLAVDWEEFGFQKGGGFWPDEEIRALDFLGPQHQARKKWQMEWPQTGNVPNWDAVGRLPLNSGESEWLLVEAKAHLGELKSSCGAKDKKGASWAKIETFLARTKTALGVPASANWMEGHYQYANRLALLDFLLRNEVQARLIFIYFTGDSRKGWQCPSNQRGWFSALADLKTHLALSKNHSLADRTHDIYLPVA